MLSWLLCYDATVCGPDPKRIERSLVGCFVGTALDNQNVATGKKRRSSEQNFGEPLCPGAKEHGRVQFDIC